MLDINISSPGYDLDDALRLHVAESYGGLDQFLDALSGVRVTFAWEGGHGEQTKVHARADAPGHHFEASYTDWRAEKAAEKARRELEAQIRREHGKQISKRHRH